MYNRLSNLTRRRFLESSTVAAGAIAGSGISLRAMDLPIMDRYDVPQSIRDPDIKSLAQRALDAATAAGADYADVRLTTIKTRVIVPAHIAVAVDKADLHVGVRALVNGYWGFAGSSIWLEDEMNRLGYAAVHLAGVNSLGKPRETMMAPVTSVAEGHWEAPMEIDPFSVHPWDLRDTIRRYVREASRDIRSLDRFTIHSDLNVKVENPTRFKCVSTQKAFASTNGSFVTQSLSRVEGFITLVGENRKKNEASVGSFTLSSTAGGWELVENAPVVEMIVKNYHDNLKLSKLPIKPVDVGLYDVVFDAHSVANMLSRTVGCATEIDRALGYEANNAGTSYLIDPNEMIGEFQIGSPHLTVSTNRDEIGGLASTGWDDEGVVPQSTVLIKDGILNDFQTSREGAGWLREGYGKLGRSLRSNGNMFSNTGIDIPKIHTANLVMESGAEDLKLEDLEAGVENGISIADMAVDVDFALSSIGTESMRLKCYELKDGKRVATLSPTTGVLLRTLELWKNITAIGGEKSVERYGMGGILSHASGGGVLHKGDVERDRMKLPEMRGMHSVSAVPIAVKDVPIIDRRRR